MDQEQENDKLRMINDCCPCYAVTKHRKKYNGISRQKREKTLYIFKALSKVKLSIGFIKEEFDCVLSFCHCEKHLKWSQEGDAATNH